MSNADAPRLNALDCPIHQYIRNSKQLAINRKRFRYGVVAGLILGGYGLVSLTRLSKQTHIWYHRRRYYGKNGHPLAFIPTILSRIWRKLRPILLTGVFVSVSVAVFGFATTSHDAFVLVFYVPLMFAGTVIFIKIVAAFTNRPELPQAETTPADTIEAVDINFGGLVYTDDGVLVPREALEDFMQQQQARTNERLISRLRHWLQLGTLLRILAFLAIVVTMMWAIGRLLTGDAELGISLMSLFWLTALAIVVGGNYLQRWINILSEYYHYWRYTPQYNEAVPLTDTFLALSDGEFYADAEISNDEP